MIKSLIWKERLVFNLYEELLVALQISHEHLQDVSYRQFFINWLESMPNRMSEVIAAEGGHTHY